MKDMFSISYVYLFIDLCNLVTTSRLDPWFAIIIIIIISIIIIIMIIFRYYI